MNINIGGTAGSGVGGLLIYLIPFKHITWFTGVLSFIGILVCCYGLGWLGEFVETKLKTRFNKKWRGIGKIPENHYF